MECKKGSGGKTREKERRNVRYLKGGKRKNVREVKRMDGKKGCIVERREGGKEGKEMMDLKGVGKKGKQCNGWTERMRG